MDCIIVPPGSQDLLNVRVLKLEDQLEKMENIISNKEQNTVFQEDLIRQIVISVIQGILKDLKTQHKNSVSLLSRQIQDNKKFYEEEIKSLNDQIEKQRNKLATANDRLRNVENKLKGIDQNITLQRNITSDEINQVNDEILKLRDHVDFSAKDLHKRCEDLSNEFKPICYSVKNQTEEFMSKSEDISGNEVREFAMPDQQIL